MIWALICKIKKTTTATKRRKAFCSRNICKRQNVPALKTDPLETIFPQKQNAFLSSAGDLFMPWSTIIMLTLKGPNEMSLVVSAYIFLYALVHALEHILMDCLWNSTACIWDYSVTHSLHTVIPIFPHVMHLSKFSPEGRNDFLMTICTLLMEQLGGKEITLGVLFASWLTRVECIP